MEFNQNNKQNPFKRKAAESVNNTIMQQKSSSGLEQFFEEDEEALAIAKKKEEGKIDDFTKNAIEKDVIETKITAEDKKLGLKYSGGGIRRQRIITSQILMDAPENYFDKYLKEAIRYSVIVRSKIAESEQSEIISKAQADPTNEIIQEKAFGIVNTLAIEVIEGYRGISRRILSSMIVNEILGFSVLDPLWRDRSIDEIICNGPKDIQVEIRGQLHQIPSCKFDSVDHMESLLLRLYEGVGKVYSQMSPTIKGRLYDNSRIFAVHPIIAPDGPNFNIRKHPDKYWTPQDIVDRNSANEELMTDIGNMIYKGASCLIIGGTSTGKAEILTTPIPTPQGWKTIGEIKPNDEVFDHYGNISKVLKIHPQGKKQVYAVKFSNNQMSYVDKEHNWYVSTYKSRKENSENSEAPLYSVKTTKEMLKEGINVKNEYNFHIPTLKNSVNFNNEKNIENLPIHPYLLGYWLGQKNTKNINKVSGTEKDIAYINNYFNKNTKHKDIFQPESKDNNKTWNINYPNFINKLTELYNKKSSLKRIPEMYKTSSIESRKLLVKGLIDSSGKIDGNNGFWVFDNTNEKLIDDYIQLTASLGYKTIKSYPKQKLYTDETLWSVSICTMDEFSLIPQILKAQKEIFKIHKKDFEDYNKEIEITDIYKVKDRMEEMVCLTVNSPENTYMSENSFITTHNTSMLNALTGFYKDDIRVITIEDNLEMKINPKKLKAAPMETRPARPDKKEDQGVTIRDLVRASTQMRPDAIVVGEVTGPEALDLVNALNTGHFGASTVHANSEEEGLYRLSSLMGQTGEVSGDGALPLIAAAFDFFIFLEHFPVDGSRRIMSISEVAPRPRKDAKGNLELPLKQLWKFETRGITKEGKVVGDYIKVGDFSDERKRRRHLDLTKRLEWDELKEISKIDEKYIKKDADDY